GAQDGAIHLFPLSVTDRGLVQALPHEIEQKLGAVDGVINCAGIIQPFANLIDLDYDDIDRVFDVNFRGTLYVTKAFLPSLLARPEAHIVNISSMGGFLPVPGQTAYGASKAAVKLLTEGLSWMMRKADRAARDILDGMEKNRLRVVVGRDAQLLDVLYRLDPVRATAFVAKQMRALLPSATGR
ncbi:MAG: SDR family NAD(P)-dependent oxidoreductase, partial [Polyangiaceae bacterium]